MRGRIAVDSSLKLALIQFGVLREKGRTILWKSVQKGCPVPTGVPSSALPVSDASSQERGLAVPVWTGTRKSRSGGQGRPRASRRGWPGVRGSALGPEAKRAVGVWTPSPALAQSLCLTLTLAFSSPHVLSF